MPGMQPAKACRASKTAALASVSWTFIRSTTAVLLAQIYTKCQDVIALRNDVGLLPEMYDPRTDRLLGRFPQAFSHVGLVDTALNLSRVVGPAEQRAG